MSIKDLKNISNCRVQRRLKESEGLLWHYCLNLASLSQMRYMKLDMPELSKVILHDDIKHCIYCKLAKAKKQPFNESRQRATGILEKVHSDTLGPITPCTFRSAHKYIVIFTNDYSRYAEGYSMYDKMQVDVALRKFLLCMRELLGYDYQPIAHLANRNEGPQYTCANGKLHTDNGTEFRTAKMKSLLKEEKIILDPCQPSTPQHNAVAECLNLELKEKVGTQLASAGMPQSYWNICMDYVMYVHNRSTNKSLNGLSPFEKLTGRKPK